MKLLSIFTLVAFSLVAQDNRRQYITSTTGAAAKLTIQKPAGSTRAIVFDYAAVDCSIAATATLSVDGTNATATALTPKPMNESSAATALAFSASNVGAGTVIKTFPVPASNATYVIDLSKFYLNSDATFPRNLTIATDLGTCRIEIKHFELPGKVPAI